MNLKIELEGFTGPFDLLVNLIEKNKIDIYDIKLEEITNDYLKEIEKLDPQIDDLSEFIYVAAILLNIKSRKLLPQEDDEENLEEDFINYLIEYKKIKSVQEDLKFLEGEANKRYSKYQEDLSQFLDNEEIIIGDAKILAKQYEKLLKSFDETPDSKELLSISKLPDVNDYLINYRKALDIRSELRLDLIINDIHNKSECIASFLALLELFKLDEIYLLQDKGNKFYIKKRM